MPMNDKPSITRDPAIRGGETDVTGTRVTVRTVLASLAEGLDTQERLQDFPTLTREAVQTIAIDLTAKL